MVSTSILMDGVLKIALSNRALARHILHDHQIPEIPTSLVAEGGGIKTDGEGTLLATESALVNSNRNPGMDRNAVESELSPS